MSNLFANTQRVTERWQDKKRRTVTVADAYCPTCGILVPDLQRLRAENEALKKQLDEKRLEVTASENGLGELT
jgi:hypothetical protein